MSRLLDLFINKYNYTDFHELNLDWLISDLRTLAETLENFISLNTIKYADPIQWNITKQYEANTVVINANDGTAYLSVQPVPTGVAITNTDYWTPIFTLNLLSANQNITLRDDGSNVLATFASNTDDWLIWNATLYKVSQAIAVNEAYVVGYNLDRYSVELFIKDYVDAINQEISDLSDELNDKIDDINDNIGNLADLETTDTSSIVNAINSIIEGQSSELFYIANDNGVTPDNADNTTALQTLIDTASENDGVIVFKSGIYAFSGSLTLYRNVRLVGIGSVIFNYTNGTDASSFITITNANLTNPNMTNLQRFGNTLTLIDNIIFKGMFPSSYPYIPDTWKNATCLNIACNEIEIHDCSFQSWNKAVEYGNKAYLVTFNHCRLSHNNTAVHFDISGHSNLGEALKFVDCIFGNNILAIYNNQGMLDFDHCSLDYNYQIAKSTHATSGALNGFEKFTDCHLEDAGTNYDTVRFTGISTIRTCRFFVNCVFHGMKYPVYNCVNATDVVVLDDCQFFFGGGNADFFTGVLAPVAIDRTYPSYTSSYAINNIGGTGTITDATCNTFANNVTDGTASASDNKLTITSGGTYVNGYCDSGKIAIPKGYHGISFSCTVESATYAETSGVVMYVYGYDRLGNSVVNSSLTLTSGSNLSDVYGKSYLSLNERVTQIEVRMRCPVSGSSSSVTFKNINVQFA